MEDAQLADHLPSYGDRVALVNYCRRQTTSSKRKHGLFEKLRQNLKLRRERDQSQEMPETVNQSVSRSKQVMRNIEIGWIHSEKGVSKQIRTKQGGGTRKVKVNIKAGFHEILKEGKALFFPEGKSSKGLESEFEFDVWDFGQNCFPRDVSIENIYNSVKLPVLRFYIATQFKELENDDIDDNSKDANSCVGDPSDVESLTSEESSSRNLNMNTDEQSHYAELHQTSMQDLRNVSTRSSFHSSSIHEHSQSSTFENEIQNVTFSGEPSYAVLVDLTEVNESQTSDPEIIIGAQHSSEFDFTSLSDTIIFDPDDILQNPQAVIPEVTLVLHHANSFNEMIEAFTDTNILDKNLNIRRLLPDNSVEKATGSGVVRDVYSSFWTEFYERCTLGTTLKVPFLRHDFCVAKWKAIGRIFLKGFRDCQYLPIRLAPPFLEQMLYGEVYSDLKKTFLQFVSTQEQDILRNALHDFSSADTDELMEVLSTYECRKMVTAINIAGILDEISHKELVQKPMFVIDCWQEVTKAHVNLSPGELTKTYKDLQPTPKKVVALLNFPSVMTPKQQRWHNT
ncbi:uncharacterized protein LOC110016336 [Oryzias latipes]|uniref:uncharacterized protein LOC110016336 n=1 Tax=Oryzias latipes TaxID=8090 RepID=UPI000CE22FC4|nr:uncharacterized protein LOC110016336 [Oryzias latipes]